MKKEAVIITLALIATLIFLNTPNKSPTGLQTAEVENSQNAGNDGSRPTLTSRTTQVAFDYCPITINDSSTLTANISATGSCVTLGTDNIELDCNGNTITWNTAGADDTRAIIATDKMNVTVKNCVLIDGNSAGNAGWGIALTNTHNSLLLNNTIQTNGTGTNYGMLFTSNSQNNTIKNNTVSAFGTSLFNVALNFGGGGNTIENNILYAQGTSDSIGLRFEGTVNNNIIRNNLIVSVGSTNSNRGMLFFQTSAEALSSNNTIVNNTIRTNGSSENAAIIFANGRMDNNTIENNTISTEGTSQSNIGIVLNSCCGNSGTIHNNKIAGNRIETNGTGVNHAIMLSTAPADNNTIANNKIRTAGTPTGFSVGIVLTTLNTSNSNLATNYVQNNSINTTDGSFNWGISLDSVTNTVITSNTIQTNGTDPSFGQNHGIRIGARSANANVTNNRVTADGLTRNFGITTENSTANITVKNNIVTTYGANQNHGLRAANGANNTHWINNTVSTFGTDSYGIFIGRPGPPAFIIGSPIGIDFAFFANNTLVNVTHWITAIDVNSSAFTNTTFTTGNGSVNLPGTFNVNGTLNITRTLMNVSFNRIFLNSTNLTFLNTSARITLFNINTTEGRPLVDFNDDGIFEPCSPSQCTRESAGFGTAIFNVSGFSSYASSTANITSCPVTLYESVNLTQNLTATGSCITIGNDDLTLDCKGHTITWNTGGGSSTQAITASNKRNVTIQNCIIIDGNSSGANGYGITLTNTNNSAVINNTIQTNGTTVNDGIRLDSVINATIANNNINALGTSSDNRGILLSTVTNSTVRNNTILTNGTLNNVGIIGQSNNNTIENNTITTRGTSLGNRGIYFNSGSTNTSILRNTITTNGTSTDNSGIVIFTTVKDNTIANNTITTRGTGNDNWGITLAEGGTVQNNQVINNTVNTNGSGRNFGIFFASGDMNNNRIERNTVHAFGISDFNDAIRFAEGRSIINNIVANNSASSKGNAGANRGIALYAASIYFIVNNSILNNNVIANGTDSNLGVHMSDGTMENNTIANNIINASGSGIANQGISLYQSTTATRNTSIVNNTINTSGLSGNHGMFIEGRTVENTTIQGNTVFSSGSENNNQGISFFRGSPSDVHDNQIVNNTILTLSTGTGFGDHAIGLTFAGGNLTGTIIAGNQINTNSLMAAGFNVGIWVQGFSNQIPFSRNNTVRENTISTADGQWNYGISIQNVSNFILEHNNVTTNGTSQGIGIRIDFGASNTTVRNNIVNTDGTSGNNFGLTSTRGNNNTFENNIVRTRGTSQNYGLRAANTDNNTRFINNTVSTTGTDSYGAFLGKPTSGLGSTTFGIDFAFLANNTFVNVTEWISLVEVNNSQFTNNTFETGNGSITLKGTFNLNGTLNITHTEINITSNKAFVNSTNRSYLNTSARISIRNMTFTNPDPTVDLEDDGTFISCQAPQCAEIDYQNGVYTFDVTGFSSYSSTAGPTGAGGGGSSSSGGAGFSKPNTTTQTPKTQPPKTEQPAPPPQTAREQTQAQPPIIAQDAPAPIIVQQTEQEKQTGIAPLIGLTLVLLIVFTIVIVIEHPKMRKRK